MTFEAGGASSGGEGATVCSCEAMEVGRRAAEWVAQPASKAQSPTSPSNLRAFSFLVKLPKLPIRVALTALPPFGPLSTSARSRPYAETPSVKIGRTDRELNDFFVWGE
jgi:hypothetical protein